MPLPLASSAAPADFADAATAPQPGAPAPQQVVKVRRDYNTWVATETMEDYALRYTPQRFRRWSEWRVANTAFGAASFLILEAVGATLLLQYGFMNAFWAIVATGVIIFFAGLPISWYAARYGVDMDLLTRGAGFGYIGSTVTSLIYASFTFIFFALEAAVMAYALELALGIPPTWGYLICAVVVIPLVTYGVSAISRLQVWTQPLWLLLLVLPFACVLLRDPGAFSGISHYGGESGRGAGFDLPMFGAALTVGIALITQMGEQADYLRFMPVARPGGRARWWFGVLAGGPGWVLPGVLKMLGGAFLAWLALSHGLSAERALDPNQMYLLAYGYLFPQHGWAVAATALFVVLSQMKINVTNAYAGSLAWSNFFSRLTHSHPGRVVWMVFNTLIACLLMEMNVFRAMGEVLGLYSNIAIAWIMAVVADLVVNKPLGLSPKGIEFKRAHLYDVNPVGVGAMALASGLSIGAHLGLFGALAQSFSALIAMAVAFVSAPLIAWATRGRYYIARQPEAVAADPRGAPGAAAALQRCVVCERAYEAPDMARCPAYGGAICSLCCTLDARCGDLCKPHARLAVQWSAALRWLLPRAVWRYLDTGLGHFLLLMLVIAPLLAAVLGLLYHQELASIARSGAEPLAAVVLRSGLLKAYLALLVIAGIVAWWLVLAHKSRQVAQEESNRQTGLLVREIELHRQTDAALQTARQVAEQARRVAEAAQHAADQANQAKSRYISAISHEIRTPLNSILGYAQLMDEDAGVPPHRRQAVRVIRRGGEHLLSLVEGTLDIARIESGKLRLDVAPMRFADGLHEIASLFELQAAAKGLAFSFEPQGVLPQVVRADEKRLRQILINLLGNAVKFSVHGTVTLRVRHAREIARIDVQDTGPGLDAGEIERIFEPFARGGSGGSTTSGAPGAGLGLTIAKMLTVLMGGELSVSSQPGVGSVFQVKLFLPEVHADASGKAAPAVAAPRVRRGYVGVRRRILLVDNEEQDRELLVQLLASLGFELRQAASGHAALDLLASGYRPHAILMDLAMPGIDGWETIRRIRALGDDRRCARVDAHIAIVSANAFDKALDNDVGIDPEDFIVKPVRHSELLDWLERRLDLQWQQDAAPSVLPAPVPTPVTSAAPPGLLPVPATTPTMTPTMTPTTTTTSAAPQPFTYPDAAALAALARVLELGHYRGIIDRLDAIGRDQPAHGAFVRRMRQLAQEFQFDAMERILGQAPE
ncbi:response regulator [Verminephrobacter aporrectodeae subsp. tuberculatae]|uniref:histidine kinase n=3 Tax=Verminephrobacter TaxID=364316 RepID=A0ABT3KXA9_9BURK|nr:ATP-binding protein [Verminephrobacter aporrectodeae]MCW5322930.1 response regulator [Verminephrobacter aporrectodeae subsp. tuberculatae]